MTGQMTIAEYLEQNPLEGMTEEELVRIMEEKTGLRFVPWKKNGDERLDGRYYEAKKGRVTVCVSLDRYCGGSRFIGVDHEISSPTCGMSSPCDTVDEAVEKIKSGLKRMQEEYEQRKNKKAYS